mmetsp:Transcript_4304/g.12362  ORF Transcript_4304/g.12362 Transcript_4304/m.12362 type:complete len:309 (+) Transcript_4304:163-1089(+)
MVVSVSKAILAVAAVLLACGALSSAFQTSAPAPVRFGLGIGVGVSQRRIHSIPWNRAIRMSAAAADDDEDDDEDASSSVSSSYQPPANVVSNNALAEAHGYPVIILSRNYEAEDPTYRNTGPVGNGEFVVSRSGGPTAEELTSENLIRIVNRRSNVTDLEVNTLVWKCLGYRFEEGEWTASEVFPKWKERFPDPPDVIGMQRFYAKEVDRPSLKGNQALHTSIPMEFKQSIKRLLRPYGFTGYMLSELTPNLTRRAQCTNWLLYYREELFGYTLEELKERRQRRLEAAAERIDNDPQAPRHKLGQDTF